MSRTATSAGGHLLLVIDTGRPRPQPERVLLDFPLVARDSVGRPGRCAAGRPSR